MPSIKTVALGLAAILISSASVNAATMHRKPVHHSSHRAMRHSSAPSRTAHAAPRATAPRAGSVSGDNSADALNARSLARAQGAQ